MILFIIDIYNNFGMFDLSLYFLLGVLFYIREFDSRQKLYMGDLLILITWPVVLYLTIFFKLLLLWDKE